MGLRVSGYAAKSKSYDMLTLVFSTYSSGSTFLQTRIPDTIKVVNELPTKKKEDIEFLDSKRIKQK